MALSLPDGPQYRGHWATNGLLPIGANPTRDGASPQRAGGLFNTDRQLLIKIVAAVPRANRDAPFSGQGGSSAAADPLRNS